MKKKKNSYLHGPNVISVRVAQICFKRFLSGSFDAKPTAFSGRPLWIKLMSFLSKVVDTFII